MNRPLTSTASAACGYTLLELTIALAIVAGLAGLVFAAVPRTLATIELRAGVRDLANTLRDARSSAIAQGTTREVLFDTQTRSFWSDAEPKKQFLPTDAEVELSTSASERLAPAQSRIRFFSDGSATGGRIVIHRAAQHYAIDIDWLTGRVRVGS